MDALGSRSRFRFGPVLEWLIAASFLAATIAVGAMILEQLKVTTRNPAQRTPLPVAVNVPAGIPARSVSVPILPFRDGKELRIGDTLRQWRSGGRAARAARSGQGQPRRTADQVLRLRGFPLRGGLRALEREGDIKVAAIISRAGVLRPRPHFDPVLRPRLLWNPGFQTRLT
jgi:hypothetical protein